MKDRTKNVKVEKVGNLLFITTGLDFEITHMNRLDKLNPILLPEIKRQIKEQTES